MSLKDRMREQREALLEREKEAVKDKDDWGKSSFGTIFFKEKIPEGMQFWRPEKGTHLVDIIPFEIGENHPKVIEKILVVGNVAYKVDLWVYTNVGAGGDHFVSPAKNFGNKDPIDAYIRKTDLTKKQYGDLRPTRRTYYLVWVHDTPEEEEKGIQIWDVAHYFFELNIDNLNKANPKGGSIAFSDIFEGKHISFEISKTGTYTDNKGKDHDSLGFGGHQFVARDEGEIPDWVMENCFSLDDAIDMLPNFEGMYEAFYGTPYVEGAASPELSGPATISEAPVEDGVCPHGFTMGVDTDEHPECGPCIKWDDCHELKERGGPAKDDEEDPPAVEEDPPAPVEEDPPAVEEDPPPAAEETEEEATPPKKVSKLKTGGAKKKRKRRGV